VRAFVCCCLAACSFSHGSLSADGATGSATSDAARDAPADGPPDAATTLCAGATPRISETFDTGPACPLDNVGGTATLVLAQGTLQISTNTNSQFSYCNEQNLGTWSGNGATIEVPSVMTGNNAWTSFQMLGPNFAMTVKNGFLVFSDNTGATQYSLVTYVAAAMHWWRMRPDAGNTNIIAEYSADRVTWTLLGAHAGGGTIRVQMIAGTDGVASPSGASRFDNLVVCP
jgi:hypothetical protein